MTNKKTLCFQQALDDQKEEKRESIYAIPLDETHLLYQHQKLINFSSFDALGLSFHSALQKMSMKYLLQYGCSSTSSLSPIISFRYQHDVQKKIASSIGSQRALLLPSRIQANLCVLSTLASSQSLLFVDSACHFSLKYALSFSSAEIIQYRHNDLDQLASLIEENREISYFSKVIVAETLPSSEGDLCSLEELTDLAHRTQTLLYLDDSHSIGSFGKNGMGIASHNKEVDLLVGAFHYGGGSSLGFVACSEIMEEYLLSFCPAFKENPLPVSALGTVDAALDLIPTLEGERMQLQQKAHFLRTQLHAAGYSTGNSSTHFVPLHLKNEENIMDLYHYLLKAHILTLPLLPPDVPPGKSRLLISLTAHHTTDQLAYLVEKIKQFNDS